MKKITVILLLALLCAAMVSCDPSGMKKPAGDFSVSLQKPKVSSDPGTQFLDVKCSGDWTLALVADGTEEVDWASLSVYSGTGDKANVRFTYKTNSTEAERSLKIYLDNGSKSVFCTFTQHAGEYRPDDDPVQTGDVDLAKTGWLELPALDDPNLGYYTHSFKMDGKKYRNYSFGWSQKDRVALWVAYPLCDLYTNGSVGRTNAWALDPYLGNDSSAPFSHYGDDYDKGHQIPSDDRQCCYEANAQTFYGTNITPQEPDLNQKGWKSLEESVRRWAATSDTLYVVTGCVVNPTKEYTTDSYGNTVAVPSAYFKAVLKYSKASTFGQWNAAAFYYDHVAYAGAVSKGHSMSIDELEEMTGIDLFVNLPAKVGTAQADKIEATNPANSSVWW